MRNEPMRRNELPETCFSILPSSGQLIIIRCGERGYYPSEWDTGNREENREIASSHNVRRGITDIQEAAMLAGSMFGWNTPGANPQWYLDNARYVNSNIVQGHIKDPIMSVYYPVSSFLSGAGQKGGQRKGEGGMALCGAHQRHRRRAAGRACPAASAYRRRICGTKSCSRRNSL